MLDLKATLMNVQRSPFQELMLYIFKLGHNASEAAKIICCVKHEEKRLFKNCRSGCKNLDNQVC